jgi:hypothetical protein
MSKHKKHIVEVNSPFINKKTMKDGLKILLIIGFLSIVISVSYNIGKYSEAENPSGAPESGATSRIKTIYDALGTSGLNYGDELTNHTWGNWGTMWNRIYSASTFSPDGTLTVGDVSPGKTFYAGTNSRTQKEGTGTMYKEQAYSFRDDYAGDGGGGAEDNKGEEAAWFNSNTAAVPNKVYKDLRTGLYWSSTISTTSTNDFTMSTCPYFSITSPTSLSTYAGGTPSCGAAINACATLSQARNTGGTATNDWYLPSQKELQQAYIDGIWNQTGGSAFTIDTSPYYYWSSSEVSTAPTVAWSVELYLGFTGYGAESTPYAVRCVSRDL